MDAKIKTAWNQLATNLQSLPPSWPSNLVFVNAPTIDSPLYLCPENPLRPNEGLYSLDSHDPDTEQFLRIQTFVARNIELYQIFDTEQAKMFVKELHHVAEGLESTKQIHWEKGRHTYHFDASQLNPINNASPPVALMLFAPLLLQTRGLSRRITTFLLQFLCLLVSVVLKLDRAGQQQLAADLAGFPQTTDHLYGILNLDTPSTTYICCTRCFALYDASLNPIKRPAESMPRQPVPPPPPPPCPEDNQVHPQVDISNDLKDYLANGPSEASSWPPATQAHCTYKSSPTSDACGAPLFTPDKDVDGFDTLYQQTYQKFVEAKLRPHLNFYVASLHRWVAELVTRPGMMDILRQVAEPTERVQDIMEAKAIREMKGPDGLPFVGPHNTGVHLCFALFMDFFNSEGNFIGGKHNSTGGIFLVILSLPIHMRYAPENMFPIFTPGGREPTTEELNNLLRPFVTQLIDIYETGIIVRTQADGSMFETDVRGMVAIIIADTPAAKKIGGFASHAHRWFCHLCRLGREHIEETLDPTALPRMSHDDHDAIAKAWRDAPTEALREELFHIYGIRFSELHRIPYLRMTECIAAEPMHAIMQNTIQHHIRRTFGINAVQGDVFYDNDDLEGGLEELGTMNTDTEDENIDSPEFRRGIAILNRAGIDVRALNMLANMRVPTLIALCDKTGVAAWLLPLHKGQPKRMEMVESLALKMAEVGSQPNCSHVNIEEAQNILSTSQDILAKKNKLRDLSPDILYETCSLAGIDTASLSPQRGSIFPTTEAMIVALLDHQSGFDQRASIQDIIWRWKMQRSQQPQQATQPATSIATQNTERLPHFNSHFLQEIWRDISKTEFPEELKDDRPPKKLGSKQHGRLKASQWRTVCCFTMLITLGRIWGTPSATQQDQIWLTNYLHLVALVRIAYSYSITDEDILAFCQHSISYLEGLRSYHPSSIKPSHHFLLHLPDIMERFGPIRGWWAFPFERFNGQIQHLNTNHKIGEVEKRFLTQWHRSSKIRSTLASQTISSLQPLAKLADQKLGTRILSPSNFTNIITEPSTQAQPCQVSQETRTALAKQGASLNFHHLKILKRVKFRDNAFECYSHSRTNGLVEYSANKQCVGSVGYIHELFQYTPDSGTCATLACIAHCSEVEEQFLHDNIALGARLCGREVQDYAVVPISMLAHVVRYPWSTSTQLIISVHNLSDVAIEKDIEANFIVEFEDEVL